MLLRLALRNLRRHPWRSLATAFGLALGVAAVLATMSVGDNVQANLRSALEAATGPADLLIVPGVAGRAVFEVDEVQHLAEATPGVRYASPVLTYPAEPVRDVQRRQDSVVPGLGSGFQLSGRDTAHPERLPASLSQGAWPQAGSSGVAVPEDFAEQNDLALGDELRFASQVGTLSFTLTGLLDDASGLGSIGGGRVGVTALADLQAAVRLGGRVSLLEVTVEDAEAGEVRVGLERALDALAGERYTVTLPAGTGDFATGLLDTLQAGLQVLATTLMALAGFMAYNTFAASVVERRREYALLRTICLTRGQVQRLALIEAGLLSVLGVVAGLLLGLALAAVITWVNASLLGFDFRRLVVPLPSVLLAAGVGVLVTLLAGYLPARAASRTPPIVAAREAELPTEGPGRSVPGALLLLLGTLCALAPWSGLWALLGASLAMGLLFLGVVLAAPALLSPAAGLLRPLLARVLGTAGKLGADFALRNAPRGGVAIGAVVVGMSLSVGVGGMVAGINRSIADWVATTVVGDLFVTSPVGLPADFAVRAKEAVPELEAVSGVAIRVVRYQPEGDARGRSLALVLVDPARFDPERGFGSFQYITGQGDDRRGYRALREGGKLLAGNTLRERFGLGLGDTVSLRTTDGFAPFEVSGVVVDFTAGGEAFVGSLDELPRFGGGSPDLFVMTLSEGADAAQARARLRDAFPELYLDVSLDEAYRERILRLTRQSFATTNGLLLLAILIAALGVANTLGMNLSDRQRELATLRALGLTREGLRRVVISEGVILVLLGTLLGLGTGTLLSQVVTAGANALTGFQITPVFPLRLMLLALLSSPLLGLLASLLPAQRASRLSPVVALGQAG